MVAFLDVLMRMLRPFAFAPAKSLTGRNAVSSPKDARQSIVARDARGQPSHEAIAFARDESVWAIDANTDCNTSLESYMTNII